MSEQSKLNHDQPGSPSATDLDGESMGITNKPVEESERQAKVVHDSEKERQPRSSK